MHRGVDPSFGDDHNRGKAEQSAGDGLLQAARSGARWLTIAQVVDVVLATGVMLVLARVVGPAAFGLVALVVAAVTMLGGVLSTPIGSVIVAQQLTDSRSLSTAWWLATVPGTLLVGGFAAVAAGFGLRGDELVAAAGVGLALPITGAAFVYIGMFRQRLAFRELATARIGAAVATASVVTALVVMGAGFEALVLRPAVAQLTQVALLSALSKWRPELAFDPGVLGRIFPYIRGLAAFDAVNQVLRKGDDLIVGGLLGSTALGLYSLAYRFIEAPVGQVAQLATSVTFPALARVRDDARFRSGFLRSQKVLLWASAPLGICSIFLGDVGVVAILGESWRDAGPLVQVFGAIAIIQAAGTQVGVIYLAREATGLLFRWSLMVLPLFASGVLVGTLGGPLGVAWGYFAVNLILIYPTWAIPGRLVGLSVLSVVRNLAPLLGLAGAVAGAGAAARLVFDATAAPTILALALGATVAFWGAALAVDRALREDALGVLRS